MEKLTDDEIGVLAALNPDRRAFARAVESNVIRRMSMRPDPSGGENPTGEMCPALSGELTCFLPIGHGGLHYHRWSGGL